MVHALSVLILVLPVTLQEPVAVLHVIVEITSLETPVMLVLAVASHVLTVQTIVQPASLDCSWRQIVAAILTVDFHSLFLNLVESHIATLPVQEVIMPCGMAPVARLAYQN